MYKPDAVLCYLEDGVAYFTTQDLATQWGDDWNDYPYQHNAGTPYSAGRYYFSDGRVEPRSEDWNADGSPKWNIITVRFTTPESATYASDLGEFCVADINCKRAAPWMTFPIRGAAYGDNKMWAGTPISRFINLVVMNGGFIIGVETD
jgi:hypothetical protein